MIGIKFIYFYYNNVLSKIVLKHFYIKKIKDPLQYNFLLILKTIIIIIIIIIIINLILKVKKKIID